MASKVPSTCVSNELSRGRKTLSEGKSEKAGNPRGKRSKLGKSEGHVPSRSEPRVSHLKEKRKKKEGRARNTGKEAWREKNGRRPPAVGRSRGVGKCAQSTSIEKCR